MDRRFWIMFIVIALVIGMVLGNIMGSQVSRIADLMEKIDQLTRENSELRTKLAQAPALPPPASSPAVAKTPGQK